MQQLVAIGMPGPLAWVVVAGIGLLVFGKRLPSVGRNLALSLRGFQQGLKEGGAALDGDDETPAAPQLAEQRKSLPDQR
jgi:TatA/E family protein of Tat protein translocase